jgi:hypothetical protein
MKANLTASFLLLVTVSAGLAEAPAMEDVVRSPADYAGRKLKFPGVTLSGNLTAYDPGGVRKYYLTVMSRNRRFEIGFFLAPPRLADKLTRVMNPRRNYWVNLTCKVRTISINGFEQWHGIVSRVDFLDDDGDVYRTVKVGKKK